MRQPHEQLAADIIDGTRKRRMRRDLSLKEDSGDDIAYRAGYGVIVNEKAREERLAMHGAIELLLHGHDPRLNIDRRAQYPGGIQPQQRFLALPAPAIEYDGSLIETG